MKSYSKNIEKETIESVRTSKDGRKGWDEAFKKAIADGDIPENYMFEGMKNAFDNSEWQIRIIIKIFNNSTNQTSTLIKSPLRCNPSTHP